MQTKGVGVRKGNRQRRRKGIKDSLSFSLRGIEDSTYPSPSETEGKITPKGGKVGGKRRSKEEESKILAEV